MGNLCAGGPKNDNNSRGGGQPVVKPPPGKIAVAKPAEMGVKDDREMAEAAEFA